MVRHYAEAIGEEWTFETHVDISERALFHHLAEAKRVIVFGAKESSRTGVMSSV